MGESMGFGLCKSCGRVLVHLYKSSRQILPRYLRVLRQKPAVESSPAVTRVVPDSSRHRSAVAVVRGPSSRIRRATRPRNTQKTQSPKPRSVTTCECCAAQPRLPSMSCTSCNTIDSFCTTLLLFFQNYDTSTLLPYISKSTRPKHALARPNRSTVAPRLRPQTAKAPPPLR